MCSLFKIEMYMYNCLLLVFWCHLFTVAYPLSFVCSFDFVCISPFVLSLLIAVALFFFVSEDLHREVKI